MKANFFILLVASAVLQANAAPLDFMSMMLSPVKWGFNMGTSVVNKIREDMDRAGFGVIVSTPLGALENGLTLSSNIVDTLQISMPKFEMSPLDFNDRPSSSSKLGVGGMFDQFLPMPAKDILNGITDQVNDSTEKLQTLVASMQSGLEENANRLQDDIKEQFQGEGKNILENVEEIKKDLQEKIDTAESPEEKTKHEDNLAKLIKQSDESQKQLQSAKTPEDAKKIVDDFNAQIASLAPEAKEPESSEE